VRAIDVRADATDTVLVVALGRSLFQVVSSTSALYGAHAAATARVGELFGLDALQPAVTGALVARGAVRIAAARVSGIDTTSGSPHDTSARDLPAISIADSAALTMFDCPPGGCALGSAAMATDGAASVASILCTIAACWAPASIESCPVGVRSPIPDRLDADSTASRRCSLGDPSGAASAAACGDWAPVIHTAGDLAIDGGVGRVLLVDSDLTIRAVFPGTGW
jgi:hypothetical protein